MRETGAAHVGPFQLTRQILAKEGVPGMFRGLTPTFMREMPGYFCFFYAYEMTREVLTPKGTNYLSCVAITIFCPLCLRYLDTYNLMRGRPRFIFAMHIDHVAAWA